MKDSDCTGGAYWKCMNPSKEDGLIVSLLRDAGAIPFVKTSVPQVALSTSFPQTHTQNRVPPFFSSLLPNRENSRLTHFPLFHPPLTQTHTYVQSYMLPETVNHIIGDTLNPHNMKRTPGGSSGGDAALVGGRGSPLGIGGDIGGSLRSPGHMSGIIAFKPSSKRMTCKGKYGMGGHCYWNKPSIKAASGPLCRSVDDVVAFMKVFWNEKCFKMDPFLPPIPFREDIYRSKERLTIGKIPFCWLVQSLKRRQRAVHASKRTRVCVKLWRARAFFVCVWDTHGPKKQAILRTMDGLRHVQPSVELSKNQLDISKN